MKKWNKENQLGHYRLLNTLASKDHLDVFEAVHLDLGRQVAIKALYLNEIKDKRERQRAVERFRQESYRLEHIRHPHIVELYDYGEEDGIPYMVMQLADYGSLANIHPLGTLLSFDLIRQYAREIGGALHAVHRAGWVHRDVKPGNIFLGSSKQTLLGDFGLVIEDHSKEMPRHFLEYGGTKVYMAPEQARGEPCAASDQYALATILFEWLTGCRPFEGTPEEILHHRLYYPAQSLRELAPDVPQEVEKVILRGLQIDPYHRFASVGKFVQALEYAFEPAVRHVAPVRLPYYAGASSTGKSHVAHRNDSRPRQLAMRRKVMPFDDRHSSEAPRRVQKEALHEPQCDEFSIHEEAFQVEEGDFELVGAEDAGFVQRVWNKLGNWSKL